jgi:ankyrin repeat protein
MMSKSQIEYFIHFAGWNDEFIPRDVIAMMNGTFVNERDTVNGYTALHMAVGRNRCKMVMQLMAACADANVKNNKGEISVWLGALYSTANILQLLIDGGGSVNEADNFGMTPLIALAWYNCGDVAARLQVLLACPDLDFDAACEGKTAEEWAVTPVRSAHSELAVVIARERARRERWANLRTAWIAAIVDTCSFTYVFITDHTNRGAFC